MSEDGECHFRLVTLGGTAVGKSSILKRFIFGNYCDRHRPTVEDLYSREYDVGSTMVKVTFLDTAGDMQFPAMRRLSIANGQAFLLVYSVGNAESFEIVKQCLNEIREQKPDFQSTPIMVVGNKSDLPEEKRQVKKEDVSEWLFCELPRMRAKMLECSAKDNVNIKDIFKSFLQLAKIPISNETPPALRRRRSSAHVTVGRLSRFNSSLSPQREQQQQSESQAEAEGTTQQQNSTQKNSSKPRSKSLIRRTSKKLAKFKEATTNSSSSPPGSSGDNDCNVS